MGLATRLERRNVWIRTMDLLVSVTRDILESCVRLVIEYLNINVNIFLPFINLYNIY